MEPEFAGPDDAQSALRKGVGLMARIPTIVAACDRLRRGEGVVPPRDDVPLAENFFIMCQGEAPDADEP